ncbi:AGAP004754-PA-like protein [Anopheles sinensis]|uniref:AGAP004754-PA-like protein n=1 Tax=Anopheles sinensis TaxID=74873 RepID=A0A084VN17_ANOSI|nr:AGAP004754-PA-like protein [Anopheles sinensis]
MLSLDMVLRIESLAADETTRHKLMFEKITRRGPKAFNTLLDICQRNFPKAYAELNPSSNNEQMHSTLNTNRIREEQSDLGSYRLSTNTERDGMIDPRKPLPSNIATFRDMLVCYATVPSFAAHRGPEYWIMVRRSMCRVCNRANKLMLEKTCFTLEPAHEAWMVVAAVANRDKR